MSKIVLSTSYFAPIQYYSKLAQNRFPVSIDLGEHYVKQSYRNRMEILGANGPLSLIVPIVKGAKPRVPVRDIRIAYDQDWQRLHWRSIVSAYNSSPFFLYYEDEILPLFEKKETFLCDLNQKAHAVITDLIGLDVEIDFSKEYIEEIDIYDFRNGLSPKQSRKKEDLFYQEIPYNQVFSEKLPFAENMSIIDLLMNEGPSAITILQESWSTPSI